MHYICPSSSNLVRLVQWSPATGSCQTVWMDNSCPTLSCAFSRRATIPSPNYPETAQFPSVLGSLFPLESKELSWPAFSPGRWPQVSGIKSGPRVPGQAILLMIDLPLEIFIISGVFLTHLWQPVFISFSESECKYRSLSTLLTDSAGPEPHALPGTKAGGVHTAHCLKNWIPWATLSLHIWGFLWRSIHTILIYWYRIHADDQSGIWSHSEDYLCRWTFKKAVVCHLHYSPPIMSF